MEKIEVNFEKSLEIINEIEEYMSKINNSIKILNDRISKLDSDNIWNTSNSRSLKIKGLNLIENFKTELYDLDSVVKKIRINLDSYKDLDKKVIGALEGNNKV